MRSGPDTQNAIIAGASALSGLAITTSLLLSGSWLGAVAMGACTVAAFVEASRRVRQLRRARALRVELRASQRNRVVEVEVTLSPREPVKLTSVRLTLACDRFEQPVGSDFGVTTRTFALERLLFEGARQLGHEERFAQRTSFELPARPEGDLHAFLELTLGFEGSPALEHREAISLDWSGRE